jgi:hypothetical protein
LKDDYHASAAAAAAVTVAAASSTSILMTFGWLSSMWEHYLIRVRVLSLSEKLDIWNNNRSD